MIVVFFFFIRIRICLGGRGTMVWGVFYWLGGASKENMGMLSLNLLGLVNGGFCCCPIFIPIEKEDLII